jgi:acetyl esterase/lipase
MRTIIVTVLTLGVALSAAIAQTPPTDGAIWSQDATNYYVVMSDQTYVTVGGIILKLDVWQNQESKKALPTVMYIHGGGFEFGDRMGAVPYLFPYLNKGWNVVNVEYRLSGQALAPAAVKDVRCALRWVYRNADKLNIDTDRVVITGHSAGGHLALMTGMLTAQDGFDDNCPASAAEKPLKVAAIVNWFGPSDFGALLQGAPLLRAHAVKWLGGQPDSVALIPRVSPITYVRPGLPPVITVHGDADPAAPYESAVRFHAALEKAGVVNQLVTIPGGMHGFHAFEDAPTRDAYAKIFQFLSAQVPGL